jgi:hypothetical protein
MSVELVYKPDFEEAKKYWRAFWAGEVIDRPCVYVTSHREDARAIAGPPGMNGFLDPDQILPVIDEILEQTIFHAEAVPFFLPNFGPDQFAAWLGAELHYEESSGSTSWSVPMIEDWDADGKDIDHPHGIWWEKALGYYRRAAKHADDKFLIGFPDYHSNMDALSALRGPQNLCMDLWDIPEAVDRAMARVRKAFAPTFEAVELAGNMPGRGYMSWLPYYSEGRFAVLQCDFACMVSPEHFRRWILPALEEESSYLDNAVYHYDGPDALVHLQDVLSIPGIHSIQWVPGSGNPPQIEWMDLLKEIRKAGKGLVLGGPPDEVKQIHRELGPEGIFYITWVPSEKEAEDLLAWLRKNT